MCGYFETRFTAMYGYFEARFIAMYGYFEARFTAMYGYFETRSTAMYCYFETHFTAMCGHTGRVEKKIETISVRALLKNTCVEDIFASWSIETCRSCKYINSCIFGFFISTSVRSKVFFFFLTGALGLDPGMQSFLFEGMS